MPLVAEHVSRSFGSKLAVDDLSVSLPEGTVTGLLGPNGAGKSTTIRIAMGLLRPDAGRISWQGVEASAVDRRLVGYLPEVLGVFERMNVLDHIAFFVELHGHTRRDARAAAQRWAARLDLPTDALVVALSKGNQQRLQLASALAHDPELIVLDEPFSGLDPVGQALVEDVMMELASGGATLVLSSHDLDRVERFCEHVALMAAGRLRYDGPLDGLRARHPALRRHVLSLATPSPELAAAVPDLTPVDGDGCELELPADAMPAEHLLRTALDAGARVVGLRLAEPSMRELFIREVEGQVTA